MVKQNMLITYQVASSTWTNASDRCLCRLIDVILRDVGVVSNNGRICMPYWEVQGGVNRNQEWAMNVAENWWKLLTIDGPCSVSCDEEFEKPVVSTMIWMQYKNVTFNQFGITGLQIVTNIISLNFTRNVAK